MISKTQRYATAFGTRCTAGVKLLHDNSHLFGRHTLTTMLNRILYDLGISSVLCLGERLLERFMFPGLHRTVGRIAAPDPTRADDILTLISEAIGLFAIIWLFN